MPYIDQAADDTITLINVIFLFLMKEERIILLYSAVEKDDYIGKQVRKGGVMKDYLHKFLVLCGTVLVILRFVPAEPGGFLSKLFLDEMIHDRLEPLSVQLIQFCGLSLQDYQTHITGLTSLVHIATIIAHAFLIGLLFYIITRWI